MANENLTTYTEVDPNGRFTVTPSKIDVVGLPANEDAYVYKDFGVDYFDDLDTLFEIYVNSASSIWGRAITGFSNTLNDFNSWVASDIGVAPTKTNVPDLKIYLAQGGWTGAEGQDISIALSLNTLYYLTLSRAAGNDTITLKVYSNAGRTNLLDTLPLAGFGTIKWRYAFGICSTDQGLARTFTGYIQNMDLQEGWSGGDVLGVDIGTVAKINGVALADIAEVNGVA